MSNEILILTGSLSLTLALIEAWMLVIIFTNPASALAKLIPGTEDLLKSHIDYLLMSLFLFAFYLLFSQFQIKAPTFIILSMCLGAIGNAGLFLIRAINPSLKPEPTAAFRLLMSISCLLTTVGYLGGASLVAASAYARM
ncbi:hypothetical protein [Methylomagnum sp.]